MSVGLCFWGKPEERRSDLDPSPSCNSAQPAALVQTSIGLSFPTCKMG